MKFSTEHKYVVPGQICTRCVMDSTVPQIKFDKYGECNYCKLHDALSHDNPNDERGGEILRQIAERIKREGKSKDYDVVVGVSGGTDSTYLLHLCVQLGLRPLAVHLDNGWNTETSVANLRNVLEALDIDLYTYVINWDEFKDVLLTQLKAGLPWADSPTDIAIVCTLYRAAIKFNVPYIFVGNNFRTEGKQPTEWTYTDGRLLNHIQKIIGTRKFESFPNQTIWDVLYFTLIKRIKMVRPFYYIQYNKKQAKELIAKKYGWKDYGGHHHENIFTRYIIGVWLYQKFGIDKRKVTLSAYVRNNEMLRAEALNELKQPPYNPKLMKDDHLYVAKKLGISLQEFDVIWDQENRIFYDYPSYFPFYAKVKWVANKVLRKILPFKPMMTYEI